MNLQDAMRPKNRERMKVITTRASRKIRSEDEMIILMKSTRNRFKKSVAAGGRIEIVGVHEWTLH